MNNPPTRTQERVLLIDDDELVAGSLREVLVRGGSQVDVAAELSSAQPLMSARQYDVVVVDPYFTGGVLDAGNALLSIIRELQPEAALIVLTAYASPSLVLSAGRERAAAFLAKPQSITRLSQVVVSASRGAITEFSNKGATTE
jgi:DNA-binding NtrC family response regulator